MYYKKYLKYKLKYLKAGALNESQYNTYVIGDKDGYPPYNGPLIMSIAKNDMYIQKSLQKGYLFEKYVTMGIYAFCNKHDTIFDVGANIGSVSIPCGKWFNVHSFEPFDLNYNILKLNVEQNNLQDSVKIHHTAVGHKPMNVTLSSQVKLVDFYTNKMDITDLNKANEEIEFNYGGIQLGKDGQKTKLINLDSFMDDVKVSLIKVDVEGAEPLVFYGAREIIKRDRPIIIFEKNWQNITDDMIKEMDLTPEIINFDIVEYCRELGYKKILYLHLQDFMLIPEGRERVFHDKYFQYWRVEEINDDVNTNNFELYKLLKVDWNRTYDILDKQVYSANNEDGIINEIFEKIGTTDKFYVEYFVKDGVISNCRYLREIGWSGYMFSKTNKNKYIDLYNEPNIEQTFKKYKIPKIFDFLSGDHRMLNHYSPRVFAGRNKFNSKDYDYYGKTKDYYFYIKN